MTSLSYNIVFTFKWTLYFIAIIYFYTKKISCSAKLTGISIVVCLVFIIENLIKSLKSSKNPVGNRRQVNSKINK